jgi:hypothetical protein
MHSILSEDTKIGPWARVEGCPNTSDANPLKFTISVLGKPIINFPSFTLEICPDDFPCFGAPCVESAMDS